MDAAVVIEGIRQAWRDVAYPGDDHISRPDSYDDEGIANYFRGTTWRGHDPMKLRGHSSAFTFFTPEAFHYWLPAFMIAAIQNPEEADVILARIADSICDCNPQRWRLFTHAQRLAVAAYLRFQIEKFGNGAEDERKALLGLEQVA